MDALTINNIEKVLDERVRPSLAQHGGDIQIEKLEDNMLHVRMHGQCSGCPSAELTLEELVSTELKEAVPELKKVVDQLIDGTYAHGDRELYKELYNSLLNTSSTPRADMYFILKDFRSYAEAQEHVENAYKDHKAWARMAFLNTACSGKFSSDRTIREYVEELWKLEPVPITTEE